MTFRLPRCRALLMVALLSLAAGPAASPAAPRGAAVASSRPEAERLLAEAWRDDVLRAQTTALALAGVARAAAAERSAVTAPPIALTAGDLVTASTQGSRLLVITLRGNNTKVSGVPLGVDFIPRGVDVSSAGLVAIAAVSQVLLYDPLTGELRIFTQPEGKRSKFGFASDVVFDEKGLLIIADMGAAAVGKHPTDGRIWQLDPASGEIVRLAVSRPLSNPKLLALDSKGRVLVVDGEGGVPISVLVEGHYDFIYRLKGKKRASAKPIFRGAGLQATAFDIDDADRAWLGVGGEVVLLDGQTLSFPCPIPPPFTFVTGLLPLATGGVQLLDGVDGLPGSADGKPGSRSIWDADAVCAAARRVQGTRLDATRGLARYVPAAD